MKHYQRSSRSVKLFDASTLEILADEVMEHAERPAVRLEVLDSCLEGLTEADRMLLRRRYEPDAKVNLIASELGVTANFLSKSFGRIRLSLLACIQGKLSQEW
jgi:DNA-directed RNA polymerase specialized sigma24 family protein